MFERKFSYLIALQIDHGKKLGSAIPCDKTSLSPATNTNYKPAWFSPQLKGSLKCKNPPQTTVLPYLIDTKLPGCY